MVRRVLGVLLIGLTSSGCAVHELHKDQDLIRSALLDLYTNQIMDNLVRAANGMPIIQLDYSNASAQVTITNSVNGSDSQATTIGNVLALPAASLSATRNIVTTLLGGGTSSNGNQVSLLATPVTTMNEVYDAYLEFLDPSKNPGSLMVEDCPPKPGMAHICKKYDGKYYWVPIEYRKLFFRLALVTTAQRGKTLSAPDTFFSVVASYVSDKEVSSSPDEPARSRLFSLKLDKKIPVDTGYLKFDGESVAYDVVKNEEALESGAAESELISVNVGNEFVDSFKKRLPRLAKITLDHRQPKAPSTDDLLNRVNFQLQQIQFNQNRLGGG